MIYLVPAAIAGVGIYHIKHKEDNGWWWLFAATIVLGLSNGSFSPLGDGCYTDWDGRSNRTICN